MGEGRDSATIIVMLLLCMLVFHSNMIYADTYIVGDSKGWSFNVQNWPSGKTFKEGDILVFNYNPKLHNLMGVDEEVYNTCKNIGKSGIYNTGADSITLVKGPNYFVCAFPGHCKLKMKIAVHAD